MILDPIMVTDAEHMSGSCPHLPSFSSDRTWWNCLEESAFMCWDGRRGTCVVGSLKVGKGSTGLLSALNPSSLGRSNKMSDSSLNLENTLEVLFVFYIFYSPVGFCVIVGSC